MITAIVRFPLGQDTTLEIATAMFEKSVPNYEAAGGLVRKYYLYGEDGLGGGVYLWKSREDAERQYSQAWRNMITEKFGSAPEVLYYDTPVIVDNSCLQSKEPRCTRRARPVRGLGARRYEAHARSAE